MENGAMEALAHCEGPTSSWLPYFSRTVFVSGTAVGPLTGTPYSRAIKFLSQFLAVFFVEEVYFFLKRGSWCVCLAAEQNRL